MPLSPAILLAFRKGHPEAFDELMQEYGGLVRAVAARHFFNLFDQEEAIQEIWLHIYQQRALLDPDRLEQVAGWIKTLAKRRCIDVHRRRRPPQTQQISLEHSSRPDSDPGPNPEEAAALKQQQEALRLFVSRLDKQQQEFVELCFVNNLDYAHIAQKLGITKLRCRYLKKVILARARKNAALLKALDRWPPTEADRAS